MDRISRFRKKFIQKGPEECWPWTASVIGARVKYGAFWDGEVVLSAHRYSYRIFFGPVPDHLSVCHRCDNPLCVNPAHLFLGTHADNNMDMVLKGRAAHKLSVEKVKDIRTSDLSLRVLAEKYGVSAQMIYRVKRRIAWRHVP